LKKLVWKEKKESTFLFYHNQPAKKGGEGEFSKICFPFLSLPPFLAADSLKLPPQFYQNPLFYYFFSLFFKKMPKNPCGAFDFFSKLNTLVNIE